MRQHTDVSESDLERAVLGAGIDPAAIELPSFSTGHISVTDYQWRTVLSDANLVALWRRAVALRAAVAGLAQATASQAGREAPRQVRELVEVVEAIIAHTEAACWFEAHEDSLVDHAELSRLAAAARTVAGEILPLVSGDDASDAAVAAGDAIVATVEQEIQRAGVQPTSSILTRVFGVNADILSELGGLDSDARLRVATRLDDAELDALSWRVLQHLLPDTAAYAPKATSVLAPMLLAERPFIAHVVAREIAERITEMDPVKAGEVLAKQRGYLPANWATQRTIVVHERRLRAAEAGDHEDAALAEAEISAAMTEGPFRRLAWTCLRLWGANDGPLPMLSELHDRLQARGEATTTGLAHAIVPLWRNAVAHREIAYDTAQHKLVIDGQPVSPDALRAARQLGMSIAYGFECGVTVARASSPLLAGQLPLEVDLATEPQLVRARLADLLAGHDIVCERIDIARDAVVVEVREANARQASAILIECAVASQLSGLGDVELRVSDRPALRASSKVLKEFGQLKGDGALPATALWVVIAQARHTLNGDAFAVYREMAERAVAATMRIAAPMLGVLSDCVAVLPLDEATAEIGQILQALLTAWRVLPGEAPSSHAGVPDQIEAVQAAIGHSDHLYSATRDLHGSMSRAEPPELPWFTPLPSTVS